MSSWVPLLLVVLAACLRFGVAEGDPLPAALVELVRNSPVSSIEDLQLLLLTDSVDEEEETSAANGGHRLPRSLNAQPAQQALCKVRTEVVEVTRAMLDRSNANFLLWPPCVEVQRCSGCCNTKSLQCVAVVTHTRYLQVMKIEYVNKRPTYAKAVVSVVDHVECRCQPAPPPKKKSTRRQHGHQHRNQTLGQGHGQGQGQVKVHSKDELHQWDELKHNQRSQLEDLLDQHWNPRGDTFTEGGGGYSLPGENHPTPPEEAVLFAPHWAHNSTRLHQAKQLPGDVVKMMDVGISKTVGDGLPLNGTEGQRGDGDEGARTLRPLRPEDKLSLSHTGDVSQAVTPSPQDQVSPAGDIINERAGSRVRPTKEPNPEPRGQARHRNNETPEVKRTLETEEAKLEEERKELLLLHRRLDQEKELLKQQQAKREEDGGKKEEEEADGRRHPHRTHHNHHRHHQQQQQTTTHTPVTPTPTTTPTTTTRQPSAPTGPRPPARPNHTKKRARKYRKRISKAAMRAMLM